MKKMTDHVKKHGFVESIMTLDHVYYTENRGYSLIRVYFGMAETSIPPRVAILDKDPIITEIPTPTMDMCSKTHITARDIPAIKTEIELISRELINKFMRT